MIKKIDIRIPELAKEVLSVQIPSYEVEAELTDFYDLPPLQDTVETLQHCGETFFGFYLDGELSGVIALTSENGVIDIHRLIVHPKHFRKGIANTLLNFVENKEEEIKKIVVSTGSKNTPAVTFYMKNGFVKTGEKAITERFSLSFFQKEM